MNKVSIDLMVYNRGTYWVRVSLSLSLFSCKEEGGVFYGKWEVLARMVGGVKNKKYVWNSEKRKNELTQVNYWQPWGPR